MNDKSSQKLIENWLGELKLNFSMRKGRSVLTRCKHIGPFYVQKSFYSEHDDTPHVYLLHPPGGLVGGDSLMLDVTLESDSRVLLTNPGASRFYRTNGMYAIQKYVFRLEPNAVLEWVPQGSIFFPQTKAKINTTFIIKQGARIISFEILFFGNLSLDKYSYPEEIDIFLDVVLSGSVGLRERLHLNKIDYIIKLGGFKISALLFALPSNEKILSRVRQLIVQNKSCQIGGATLLDEILVVRLLSNDSQLLKNLLHNIWYIIRPDIIGRKVTMPRIWYT